MASKKDPVDAGQTAPDLEIVGDQVTLHPSGFTGGYDSQDDAITERNLVRHMARFRENPFDFLREVSLFVSGTGWRAYDSVIGQPVYYPGYSNNIKRLIVESPLLRSKVKELAQARLQVEQSEGLFGGTPDAAQKAMSRRKSEIEKSLHDVVETMMDGMICKMDSKAFIRGAYYIATQLLTRAYHQGIHVSSEEILRLRSVAQTAADNKQSIIFLPNHKSHVDYVSLQVICYRLGLGLPIVVAGDNLNFPVVGAFLQHAGETSVSI